LAIKRNSRIAIIGAGMAGLTIAERLTGTAEIVLFDKARGVGGRMSSRYAHPFYFDHAAQYFTVRSKEFRAYLQPHISQGLVQPWYPNILTVDAESGRKESSKPLEGRFVSIPAMNSLCKEMARGREIILKTRIARLEGSAGDWRLVSEDGREFGPFSLVILTAPAPQTRELLPGSLKIRRRVAKVEMLGCFSLLLGFEEQMELPWQYCRILNSPLARVFVNNSKPGRYKEATSVVLHSDNHWAEEHLEEDREELAALLMKELRKNTGIEAGAALYQNIMRWRYADTIKPLSQGYLYDEVHGLAVAGDWCRSHNVESAFLSGYQLADTLMKG
jgi:hypothetical protein